MNFFEIVFFFFFFQKWTRPSEKLQRELSVAEESQFNRKRLRGIALAIQAVISLLHHVRNKRTLCECLNNPTTNQDTGKVTLKPSQSLSRIPLPKPSCGYHIANIRRSLAVANNSDVKQGLAPDCSFKKGHFKREEVISTSGLRNRSAKLPVKKTISSIGIAASSSLEQKQFPGKVVKRRPVSLVNINHVSVDNSKVDLENSLEDKDLAEKSKFDSTFKIAQKSNRARPISMIVCAKDLGKLTTDIGDLHIIDGGYSDKTKQATTNQKLASLEKVIPRKANQKSAQRPVSLLIKEMKRPTVIGAESPSSNESSDLRYSNVRRLSVNVPRASLTNRQSSLIAKSTTSPGNCNTNNTSKINRLTLASPKNSFATNHVPPVTDANKRSSFPLNKKQSTSEYHKSTISQDVSEQNKTDDSVKSGIQITTQTNKIQNIKFPDGKTVDKETKTTTTVSIPERKVSPHGPSLLKKVKNLAREIENLSNDNALNLSTESIASNFDDDYVECKIQEYTDRFSETEYLSVANDNDDT